MITRVERLMEANRAILVDGCSTSSSTLSDACIRAAAMTRMLVLGTGSSDLQAPAAD